MNNLSEPSRQISAPQATDHLLRLITRPAELAEVLQLDLDAKMADAGFPLRVPAEFLARMRPGDPDDPLLRQILPTTEETHEVPGYNHDPVGDLASSLVPGVLQKYRGRALLITTGACAVHCRYCFRRAYPYAENALAGGQLQQAISAIAADPSISEVILSGGDPLTLSNRRIAQLLNDLSGIAHLTRLRIHTRIPVVSPGRVDSRLLDLLAECPLPIITVIHCNHANEIDAAVATAVADLKTAGSTLLNQSVLLKGINDKPAILVELSERLFDIGVMPYYLHQLDPVAGAAHFNVDDSEAIKIITEVAKFLPGYLVPKLVRETPGAGAKTPLQT